MVAIRYIIWAKNWLLLTNLDAEHYGSSFKVEKINATALKYTFNIKYCRNKRIRTEL